MKVYLEVLMERVPYHGYLSDPTKIILVVSKVNFAWEMQVFQVIGLKVVMVNHILGILFGEIMA